MWVQWYAARAVHGLDGGVDAGGCVEDGALAIIPFVPLNEACQSRRTQACAEIAAQEDTFAVA